MKEPMVPVTFFMPVAVESELVLFAKETGRPLSTVVREIVTEYLHTPEVE